MNEERAGRLSANSWSIPPYIQKALWLDNGAQSLQVEGELGLFEFKDPAPMLTLRWGAPDGVPVRHLAWQTDDLGWRGEVRVGGMVECIHYTEIPEAEALIGIVHISGHALAPQVAPYLSAARRMGAWYRSPDFYEGIVQDQDPALTTWLVPDDSPLMSLAHDALMNKMPLYLFGQLAKQESLWQKKFALPIIFESATIFAH